MSWFNKNKIVVNTKCNRDHGLIWTLINNETGERKDYCYAHWMVENLIDKDSGVNAMIAEVVNKEVAKELTRRNSEKFNKHFTFFLNKDVAPLILNKMDAMECVG